ncbi:hypothetical protein CAP35_03460 [Chitinophagaceae bacterium IBVUCB1]|nr:hypothetical protein CAP35_03460 [Chitinophagaceae bacterium IBVUCB1]
MQLQYHKYSIDVKPASSEKSEYNMVISEDVYFMPSTSIDITVSNDGNSVSRILVEGFAGATGIYDDNILIDDSYLLLCVSDCVYRLRLPNLELDWKRKCDVATCFTISKFKEDYLIHGELQIVRLSKQGDIKWVFSARDIFVLPNRESQLLIDNDVISIKDWQGYIYYLDENGKVLKEDYVG